MLQKTRLISVKKALFGIFSSQSEVFIPLKLTITFLFFVLILSPAKLSGFFIFNEISPFEAVFKSPLICKVLYCRVKLFSKTVFALTSFFVAQPVKIKIPKKIIKTKRLILKPPKN